MNRLVGLLGLKKAEKVGIQGDCIYLFMGGKYYASTYIVSEEVDFGARDAEPGELVRFLQLYSYTLSQLPPGTEIKITKLYSDKSKILRRIENDMVNIRALLERIEEPHVKIKLERKLVILKKIYEHMINARDIERVVIIVKSSGTGPTLDDACEAARRNIEHIEAVIRLNLGIKTRRATSRIITKILLHELGVPKPPGKAILIDNKRLAAMAPVPYRKKPDSVEKYDGIYLGNDIETGWPVIIDYRQLTKHILIIGPTGRGKTTLLASIIENIYIKEDMGFVAVDFKGDLVALLKHLGVPVISIDKYPVNILIRPRQISSADWGLMLSDLLAKVFIIERSKISQILSSVFVNDPMRPPSAEEILTDKSLSVLAPVIELATTMPRYDDIINLLKKQVIVDSSRGGTALQNMYAGIIIFLAKTALMHNAGMRLVVIDEAWRIASLETVIELVKEGRSRGIGVVLATQNIEDIPTEIIDNTHTLIVFGTHNDDYIDKVRRKLGLAKHIVSKLKYLDIGEAMLVNMLDPHPMIVKIRPPLILENTLLSEVMKGGLT